MKQTMFFPAILMLALMIAYSDADGLSYRSLIEQQWQEFKLKHKRIYASENEEEFRLNVFMKNMEKILKHNKLYEMGLSTYRMAMNQFGDLSDEEYRRYYMMPYNSIKNEDLNDLSQKEFQETFSSYLYLKKSIPKNIDWRKVGAVTKVKNQQINETKCGACYAFAALGALEAQHFIKTKKLVSLSEQNIVDCTYKKAKYRNTGCSGGRVDYTFKYIILNHGVDTEESYPYVAVRQEPCGFKNDSIGARMSKYVDLPSGDEKALKMAVAWIGPVAVMVDNRDLMFYGGGIYDNPSCRSKQYSHGMLVVGYGTYRKIDYWLLKNSWGEGWGEMGYIMMVRNKNNQCAIATAALYPLS